MLWELVIDEIETTMRVGICEQEKTAPQRLLVSARIWAEYAAVPTHISQCVDYGLLADLVTITWPGRAHTDLLEPLAIECMQVIFNHHSSITAAEVSITKPDIFAHTRQVGVRLSLTRNEWKGQQP